MDSLHKYLSHKADAMGIPFETLLADEHYETKHCCQHREISEVCLLMIEDLQAAIK